MLWNRHVPRKEFPDRSERARASHCQDVLRDPQTPYTLSILLLDLLRLYYNWNWLYPYKYFTQYILPRTSIHLVTDDQDGTWFL